MENEYGISRRDLLLGAGMVAAGYGALAPMQARAAMAEQPGTPPVIMVEVDGQTAGYATAVNGGMQRVDAAAMPGGSKLRVEKTGSQEEPVTVRFQSMPGAKFPDWFVARDLVPREVAIVLCDPLRRAEVYRLSMSRTRIVGIRLPGLNPVDPTRGAEFEVTFLPGRSTHSMSNRAMSGTGPVPRAQALAFGLCRLMFQGLESMAPMVSAVAPLTLEADSSLQSWKRTSLKFASVLDNNGTWYAWYNDARIAGKNVARPGLLQFLSYEGALLGTVDLTHCVPVAASPPFEGMQSIAQVPLVNVEVSFNEATLHIERMIG